MSTKPRACFSLKLPSSVMILVEPFYVFDQLGNMERSIWQHGNTRGRFPCVLAIEPGELHSHILLF